MELQQLRNLTALYMDDGAREPVKVMDANGDVWPVMSLGWSTVHQCFIVCFDDEDWEGSV